MADRTTDWWNQAQRDVSHAESAWEDGRHEWACFAAQQGAEKAVKALHLSYNQESWGHMVARLLKDLPSSCPAPEDLIERAQVLDNFYIPARYPDSHPEGAPFEHFGSLQSQTALEHARAILDFVRPQLAERREGS
jgi:HEPN domain-containing protein